MLGKIVTEGRRRLGLTQHEAATAWDMSRAELSMIEAGHRGDGLRAGTARKLARGLGMTVDELLERADGGIPQQEVPA